MNGFVLNWFIFVETMTGHVLNMSGCYLNMTEFVINYFVCYLYTTKLFINMTGFVTTLPGFLLDINILVSVLFRNRTFIVPI